MLFKKSNVLDQLGFYVFIEEKLRKYKELLFQILIRKIDSGVHYSDSVRSYRIGNVSNVYCVQVFVCALTFNEYLVVQVVQVASDKHVYVAHDFQNIKTLIFVKVYSLIIELDLK